MKSTCRTGRFLRGTVLIAAVFCIINAIFVAYKFDKRKHQASEDKGKRNVNPTYQNETSISDSHFPHKILYRNTYWQIHRSFVNFSICNEDKNVSSKSNICPPNKIKNLSIYEEVVAYSSFYDDRSNLVSPRWVQVLAVVKIVPRPGPIYCQIWLRNNDMLIDESMIMTFLTSHGKTNKSLEMTLSRVYLDGNDLLGMTGNPPTWMYEVQSVSHSTGKNHHFPDISYGQRQFSCPMRGIHPSLVPTHVSLTFKRGERSTILLSVQYPEESRQSISGAPKDTKQVNNDNSSPYKHEFVVCVTQAYDYVNPIELIEWMEFHKILGVTKINIYNGTVRPDKALESVFRHYTKTGLLSLYQIPPAVLNQSDSIVATKLSSPASLNDCMMRYIKSARWVIVVDFDEVILPTRVDSYAALLKQLEEAQEKLLKTKKSSKNKVQLPSKVTLTQSKSTALVSNVLDKGYTVSKSVSPQGQYPLSRMSAGSISSKVTGNQEKSVIDDELTYHLYMFNSAYFFRNFKLNNSTTSSNETLFTSRYRWRTKHLVGESQKSFVDPRHCLSIFNHWCWLTWTGKPMTKLLVDPGLAFVQHYRQSCSFDKKRCTKLAAESVLDNNAGRFQKRLLEQVTRAKKDIFR